MLNYIWAVMIAIGVIYGALTGNIEAVANGATVRVRRYSCVLP
jgi:spore maturation protein A